MSKRNLEIFCKKLAKPHSRHQKVGKSAKKIAAAQGIPIVLGRISAPQDSSASSLRQIENQH
jgi:hypothetical protein